jgi:hypothetical protein
MPSRNCLHVFCLIQSIEQVEECSDGPEIEIALIERVVVVWKGSVILRRFRNCELQAYSPSIR